MTDEIITPGTVRLPERVWDRARIYAAASRLTVSAYIRQLIELAPAPSGAPPELDEVMPLATILHHRQSSRLCDGPTPEYRVNDDDT